MRDLKNLKGTWHPMLARSRQLQGIFGLLNSFRHVQILICFVDVYQNHSVVVVVVLHLTYGGICSSKAACPAKDMLFKY